MVDCRTEGISRIDPFGLSRSCLQKKVGGRRAGNQVASQTTGSLRFRSHLPGWVKADSDDVSLQFGIELNHFNIPFATHIKGVAPCMFNAVYCFPKISTVTLPLACAMHVPAGDPGSASNFVEPPPGRSPEPNMASCRRSYGNSP